MPELRGRGRCLALLAWRAFVPHRPYLSGLKNHTQEKYDMMSTAHEEDGYDG
jgi:hypothetical protein